MIIGILDGYTIYQEDIDKYSLGVFGDCIYEDRLPAGKIPKKFWDAEILVANKFVLDSKNLPICKNLKLIIVSATGYNYIDQDYCKAHGIPVCNVPGYGTDSVAQHVFALLLNYTNQVAFHVQSVKNQDWANQSDFAYQLSPFIELKDKIIGIIGMGAIGKAVAHLATAFGMQVIYSHTKNLHLPSCTFKSLDELYSEADFISLNCPANQSNIGMICSDSLNKMKPSAVLINTARGILINELDLYEALKNEQIKAALLDVLSQEPPPLNHPLTQLKNCLITPHNAWMSFEARSRLVEIMKNIIQSYLNKDLIHRVI